MAKIAHICSRIGSNNASQTVYGRVLSGGYSAFNNGTDETVAQTTVRTAGTFSGLWIYMVGNSRGASTMRFRKNGADGNQVVSIGASATGLFADASNSDTVAAGDNVCHAITIGAGGTNFENTMSGVAFDAGLGDTQVVFCGGVFGGLNAAGLTRWSPLAGSGSTSITEASAQNYIPIPGTLSDMCVGVGSNSATFAVTYQTRINGADGNLTISVGAGPSSSLPKRISVALALAVPASMAPLSTSTP